MNTAQLPLRIVIPTTMFAALPALGLAGLIALHPLPAPAQTSPCGPTTTVQAGDTLSAIAQRCDVSLATIQAANPDIDPNVLQIGQTLQLSVHNGPPPVEEPAPQPAPEPEQPEQPEQTYTVQPGDDLDSIAAIFGMSVAALLEANPELGEGELDIGSVISPFLPSPEPEPEPVETYSGLLTAEGVQCQAMRGTDGALYTLVGELGGYRDGDLVEVEGEVAEMSICQQGTTIEVTEIRGTTQ